MFYEWKGPGIFHGADEYLDISGKLHHFLKSESLGLRIRFSLEASGIHMLLAVYYKESLMPDFSVFINRGYVTVTTRSQGRLLTIADTVACNDGLEHEIVVNGTGDGLKSFLDGRLFCHEKGAVPYCEFGYVGFATVGRGALLNSFGGFFKGVIYSVQIDTGPMEPMEATGSTEPMGSTEPELVDLERGAKESGAFKENKKLCKTPIFCKGMAGVENYRIPALVTTPSKTVIAVADARMDAPGDNPNHIARAIRRSMDSGHSWEEVSLFLDFGGTGREGGAAAMDGQLLVDEETGTVFMLYGHTPAGTGSANSCSGTGFDDRGRRILTDGRGGLYYQEGDGRVFDGRNLDTGYQTDAYDGLYRDGVRIGSVCQGGGELSLLPTAYLQLVESHDDGRTWSLPRDLNFQVKRPYMRFLGPGPGTGLCMKEGPHKGRLVSPVYFSNEHGVYMDAVIYSDDHGSTWRMGESVNEGRRLNGQILTSEAVLDGGALLGECQLLELPGGILKFFMRNPHYKRVAVAFSADGGQSFHDFAVQEDLVNPDCQFHVLRLDSENGPRYLFSGSRNQEERVCGVILESGDGTQSFQPVMLLECGEFAYSCMARLPDGQIGILYEGLDVSIYFTKFSIG